MAAIQYAPAGRVELVPDARRLAELAIEHDVYKDCTPGPFKLVMREVDPVAANGLVTVCTIHGLSREFVADLARSCIRALEGL